MIATASPSDLNDLAAKVEKAKGIRGTKVIIVLIPCLPGWGVADDAAVQTARLGVETGVFPLFEVEDGLKYTMSVDAKTRPVEEYLKLQKRYRHLKPEDIEHLQADVDQEWDRLLRRASATDPV